MTAALAANTTTQPPDPAAQQGGWVADAFKATWNWAAETVPGGNLTVLSLVFVLAMLANGKSQGGTKTSWKKGDQAVGAVIVGVFKALWGGVVGVFKVLWFTLRFYGGRELRGEPRSDATFFRAGTRTTRTGDTAAVTMASVALAPPRVSLVKPQRRRPRPWAVGAASWIQTYAGRGATVLDRTVRTTLWCARAAVKLWRGLQAVYRFVAPVAATIARVLGMWHCWPYAARGLARLALTVALFGLTVPAWRTWTIVGLVLALAAVVVLAHRVQPKKPGDDAVYGPRIWAILRNDLKLPEDEPRENWMILPESLATPDARIVIRLPWTWRGSEGDRENLSALVNSRLPGEWVARVTLTGETFTAVYTHKPPPKPQAPAPEPPAAVDIWDPKVQEILGALGPDEFYCGLDAFDLPVIQKMSDEQAHWALSVGSGGGKSAFLQWLAIQMLMKRGTIIGIDPKMVSLIPIIGIQGVHTYGNPQAPQDMRATLEWVAEVVTGRNYEKKHKIRTDFLPLYVFLEECNQLADILKEEYTAIKESGAPAGDPIWRDGVATTLRLGREVNVHIIAVFQDFKDTQFGNVSLVPLFPFKILGSYSERQWKRIMGSSIPMPPIQKKAGRMVLALDTGEVTRIQTPYVPWDDELTKDENQQKAYKLLTAYYKELRATHGYSTEGLYTAPPSPSPEIAPAILRRVSRDTGPEGSNGGSEGGLSDKTAGRGVTHPGSVTPGVTPQRDRLRLIPGQAGAEGSEALKAPALLTIAEIAREMNARGYDIEAGLIRQHKRRKESTGFPDGIEIDGTEKFTLGQLITFYEHRGIEKREESEAEAEQGDAV
ncbi:hypothetical protein ACFWDI_40855 [Streptomyces sp. NPDC060064]|uniref:hypothetical protein n=1 Tax=Streptomyces sp. NPDC060064 TaxID=3347049 RepID=UPI0036CAB292